MDLKKCIFCGEDISVELRRCPYCGSLLNINNDEQMSMFTKEKESEYTVNSGSMEADVAQMCIMQADDGSIAITECEQKTGTAIQGEDDEVVSNIPPKSHTGYYRADMANSKNSLSNALKVFLTVLCTFIPGLGQLIGVIISIIFINSEEKDKNSFGVVLMVTSIIFFILSILIVLIHLIVLTSPK